MPLTNADVYGIMKAQQHNTTKGYIMLNKNLPYCGLGNIENLNNYMRQAFAELIVVPNSWLPEDYHDNVRGGRTLARLDQMADKAAGLTEHRKLKALKAENIENYRKQYEESGQFEYNGHRDELQLHKNQMAFVGGMVNRGMIDADDLMED